MYKVYNTPKIIYLVLSLVYGYGGGCIRMKTSENTPKTDILKNAVQVFGCHELLLKQRSAFYVRTRGIIENGPF